MGVALRCSPGRPAAHLLQAARGVRRGASRDQLLSPPPLYSGSIRRDAAYAPCQSPASRSRGGLPGVGRQVCSGRNRRIDSRTRASGTGAADGRASGQTDGLADTGGWAGSARPGRRGRGGGAAARAEAAEGSAARSEAAPWRGPCAPPARACEYGGAGLEPPEALPQLPEPSRARPRPSPCSPEPHPTLRSPAADVPLSSLSGGILELQLCAGKRTRRPVEPALGHWGSGGLRKAACSTYRTVEGLSLRDCPAGFRPLVARPRPRGGATLGPAPESTSGPAELGAPAEVACGPDLRSRPHERGAPGGLQQQRLGG